MRSMRVYESICLFVVFVLLFFLFFVFLKPSGCSLQGPSLCTRAARGECAKI